VSQLLRLSLPGIDEVAALQQILELAGSDRYQRIVVDTAPTGHLLRMLTMPAVLSGLAPLTGAAFLAARKQARDKSRTAALAIAEAAEAAFELLSKIAREGRRRTDEPLGAAAPILDAAFLVPARRRARFHAAAERLAQDVARTGGRMTVSGPWPAYNIVDTAAVEGSA
jgi:anion-transporting  ArsA/GET3 family ATPase